MLKRDQRNAAIDRDTAEAIAAQGLAFLAEDILRLQRFLALTGLHPADLRARAGTADVLCAVLSHFAGDESLLLTFAANSKIQPEAIVAAHDLLQRSHDA